MGLPVGYGSLAIGLVCFSVPFWFWSTSLLGSVSWIDVCHPVSWLASVQGSTLPLVMEEKDASPDRRKRKSDGKLKTPPVFAERWNEADVILFDELCPGPSHDVWKSVRVQFVVWWKSKSWSGPPKEESRWIVSKLRMEHATLGGVTTRVDWIFVASRFMHSDQKQTISFLDWWKGSMEKGLSLTTVRGIIKPTEHGKPRAVSKVKSEDLLCDRKMNWKLDREKVHILPSVFSPTGLVQRKLVPKELALALDFPSQLSAGRSDEELSELIDKTGPPFKTRVQVVRLIRDFIEQQTSAKSKKRERPESSRTDSKVASSDVSAHGMKVDEDERVPDDMEILTDNALHELEREEDRNLKATKSDDAAIPHYLWNDRILDRFGMVNEDDRARGIHALDWIRHGALIYWKRLVSRSFWRWWRDSQSCLSTSERQTSIASGLSALRHSALASWWDWDAGSSPFFWRMPDPDWLVDMRDGVKPMWIGPPPKYRIPQRPNPDPAHLALEKKKIGKVRKRGYIGPTEGIRSLTSFFSVPKGPSDIRMVYDGTKSGLNDSLLAPWFGLATVDAMLRTVCEGTWSGDNDFGEMFLNFWIHPEIRSYTGVDLTTLFPEELDAKDGSKKCLWEAWTRCAMGVTVSPYQTTQCTQRVKRIVFGCRFNDDNIFRWTDVRLNLPGNDDYDPSKPWICKVREDGKIAVDVHSYVDDLRGTAPSEEEAWQASSAMAKGSAYFGLQDAARKRRPPSQNPGAWAGAVVETTSEAVFKTVSQERWDKTKKHVATLADWAGKDDPINRKELERIRGFLVYVSLTFKALVPYLKGIHLTLESWRPDRDSEGWRVGKKQRQELVQASSDASMRKEAPIEVEQVPRFKDDIRAIKELTDFEKPPKLLARPRKGSKAVIVFADASGEGFGSSLWIYGSDTVDTEHGLWTRQYGSRSSNFRELYNLILRLEALVHGNQLEHGAEVFMFTDNATSESAFYRGTSSSYLLFSLVLRARKMEMDGRIFLRVVWVAGTRMIAQGTDGLSRGDLMTGVMAGSSMLFHVPLNRHCEERQPGVVPWLKSNCDDRIWVDTTPTDWFDGIFNKGNFVWTPPPCIADVAVDQLCDSVHIRPRNSHIFVCPALMTYLWRKKLGKVADFVFKIPAGCGIWSQSQHEPLIVAFVLPHLFRRPWQVRRAKGLLDDIENHMREMWSSSGTPDGSCLRQLWAFKGYKPSV